MTRTMSRVAVGALLAAVVLGLLCYMPMAAHASSKTTVYVITKEVKKTAPSTVWLNGKEVTQTTTTTSKYTYNKAGLIQKYRTTLKEKPGTTWTSGITFTLDGKNRFVSAKYKLYAGDSGTQYYALDKKGRVKSVSPVDYKYYPNGRLKKTIGIGYTNTFTWNSKGLLTKVASKSSEGKGKVVLSYDAKKQLATLKETFYGSTQSFAYKNTYDKKLLTKRVNTQLDPNGDGVGVVRDTTKFTYKKIKVPKKLAAQVKAQQKWILLQSAMANCYPPLEGMYK